MSESDTVWYERQNGSQTKRRCFVLPFPVLYRAHFPQTAAANRVPNEHKKRILLRSPHSQKETGSYPGELLTHNENLQANIRYALPLLSLAARGNKIRFFVSFGVAL